MTRDATEATWCSVLCFTCLRARPVRSQGHNSYAVCFNEKVMQFCASLAVIINVIPQRKSNVHVLNQELSNRITDRKMNSMIFLRLYSIGERRYYEVALLHSFGDRYNSAANFIASCHRTDAAAPTTVSLIIVVTATENRSMTTPSSFFEIQVAEKLLRNWVEATPEAQSN